MFYRRGSAGINVEANPSLISKFREFRNRDTNLGIGVGPPGTARLYVMEDSSLSTFSQYEAEGLQANGRRLLFVKDVEMVPLQELIERHSKGVFPDFLSMDIEGFEMEVLRSIAFDNGPKVICIETAKYHPTGQGPKNIDLMAHIEGQGYILYADTNLNSIYVKRDFWSI